MSTHLTPLEVCERLFGPFPVLAKIAGKDVKTPYSWRRASDIRAAGDLPSSIVMRKFLNHARRKKIIFPAEWLIEGAPIDDVIALADRLKADGAQKVAAE